MLNFVKTLFLRIFIHSQFWVALMAVSLTSLTLFELKSDALIISLSVGLLTWGGYAYIRSFSQPTTINYRYYTSLKWFFIPISIVTLSIGVYLLYDVKQDFITTIISLSVPAFLVLLYPLQLSRLSIREIPGLKITIICLSWVWLTTVIPSIYTNNVDFYQLITMSLQRFLFLFVWTLPFDIRDVEIDTKNLRTIPQLLSISKTKNLLYVLIFLLQVSYIVTAATGNTHYAISISYILGLEFLVLLIYFSRISIDNGYYSVLVESIPLSIIIFLLITAVIIY